MPKRASPIHKACIRHYTSDERMKHMVTVAVVGVGGMGKTHLDNLRSMENVKIDSICDPNPSIAALAEELEAGYYTDLDELLSHTAAEIVMVFTPTFLHARQIEAVLRSGRHCISEKPLCLSSKQAAGLFALADEMRVCLYVAQVLHFTKEYQLLEEIVRSGRYGRVKDAFFYRLTERPKWLTGNWLFDPEKSGLIPYDLHIHELDFIVSLFGRPAAARRHQALAQAQQEHYRFLYSYDDLTVCAEASWYNAPIPFTHGFRLCFEHAVVVYENQRFVAFEEGAAGETLLMETPAADGGTAINVSSPLPYLHELEHFFACAFENKKSDVVKEENVLIVLETLEALLEKGA